MSPPSMPGKRPRLDPAPVDATVRLIGECPLFRGLDEAVCLVAARSARNRDTTRGEVLFREGEPVREFGVVARGGVKLSRAATGAPVVFIQLVGPAEACDWPGMLTGETHAATAVSAHPGRLLVWERARMRELFDSHPVLYRNALRLLARRQRDLSERYRELTTLRVPQRLARALLRLSSPEGHWLDRGGLREIPLSRRELAQVVGTTLFTVSRLLAYWEGRGLVEAGRERVRVEKPDELALVGRLGDH